MGALKWGILIFCLIVIIFILTRTLPPPITLSLCKVDSDCPANSTCNSIGLCAPQQFIISATIAQDSANEALISGNNFYEIVAANRYMETSQNYSQLLQALVKLMQTITKYHGQAALIGFGPNASIAAAINASSSGQSLSLQAMPIPDLMDAVAADFNNNADVTVMKNSMTVFMDDINNASVAANNLNIILLS